MMRCQHIFLSIHTACAYRTAVRKSEEKGRRTLISFLRFWRSRLSWFSISSLPTTRSTSSSPPKDHRKEEAVSSALARLIKHSSPKGFLARARGKPSCCPEPGLFDSKERSTYGLWQPSLLMTASNPWLVSKGVSKERRCGGREKGEEG
jgi:hypothetical protein